MNRQIENRYVLRCIEGVVVGWSDTIRHFFVFLSPIITMFHNGEILRLFRRCSARVSEKLPGMEKLQKKTIRWFKLIRPDFSLRFYASNTIAYKKEILKQPLPLLVTG